MFDEDAGANLIKALTCCASCGKDSEPFDLQMCTACRGTWYCNRSCQSVHRKAHRKICNQNKNTLGMVVSHIEKCGILDSTSDATIDDDDDDLFHFTPPVLEDCPLCLVPLPPNREAINSTSCCGIIICYGCFYEHIRVTSETNIEREDNGLPHLDQSCPFCRAPAPSLENMNANIKKRMERNDSQAIMKASQDYLHGTWGHPKDLRKAFELIQRAAELGDSDAYGNLAPFYGDGLFVPKDATKEQYYNELAAKAGNTTARFNLGINEFQNQNNSLANKHWLISAAGGDTPSLENIARSYQMGDVSKEEYKMAVLSYRKLYKDSWSQAREEHADKHGAIGVRWDELSGTKK
jgi:hypothetical protein